jgi:ribosome-binding factor A
LGTKRTSQIGEVIRETLATMLARGEVADPRLKGLTIHSVKVTADLSIAKVYYSSRFVGGVLPAEDSKPDAKVAKDIATALKQASGFFRKQIASSLNIRHAPELNFYVDESLEESVRIGALLNKLKDEGSSS